MWPALTAIALFFIVATWAIVLGVLEMVNGLRLRNVLEHAWLLALAGAFFAVLGIVMLANPVIGVAFLVATTATFAFVIGGVNVLLGLRLHALGQPLHI
jgi:uncharacterized membrane protein HdeD (DUF308 family)